MHRELFIIMLYPHRYLDQAAFVLCTASCET